jgi:hypothetical protein
MFRCDNCGSGYSARAATWESCPRCYAREGAHFPLAFEVGWHAPPGTDRRQPRPGDALAAQPSPDAGARPAALS